jgi:unsaturated pyranuronate lyase
MNDGRAFASIGGLLPVRIWDGIVARIVAGERISMAVVELDAHAIVGHHRHENEQLGILLEGSMRFTVAGETKELGPGDTWCIPSGVEHEAKAGAEGAIVIDVFSPVRDDWAALEPEERSPRWPRLD